MKPAAERKDIFSDEDAFFTGLAEEVFLPLQESSPWLLTEEQEEGIAASVLQHFHNHVESSVRFQTEKALNHFRNHIRDGVMLPARLVQTLGKEMLSRAAEGAAEEFKQWLNPPNHSSALALAGVRSVARSATRSAEHETLTPDIADPEDLQAAVEARYDNAREHNLPWEVGFIGVPSDKKRLSVYLIKPCENIDYKAARLPEVGVDSDRLPEVGYVEVDKNNSMARGFAFMVTLEAEKDFPQDLVYTIGVRADEEDPAKAVIILAPQDE